MTYFKFLYYFQIAPIQLPVNKDHAKQLEEINDDYGIFLLKTRHIN